MNRILSYTLYPMILITATLAYLLSYQLTHMHLVALYCGVTLSAIIVYIAEKFYPLHTEWIPEKNDLVTDVFFYSVIVQVFFPFLLYFTGTAILKCLGFKEGIVLNIWPHHYSKITQFFLLAISGEFFQYWWHRLCHTYRILWPVHAPHHFPQKLYSWNTSRFHFLDKLVEFFFTIFIFMALGLSFEILSYYYLFFAITGYIQHSNLGIKMGWLDYIIASGETHRFHHDSNISKSKINYANNFVLFDLLFKTFKRAPDEKLVLVGVRSKNTPKNLQEETLYPITYYKAESFKLILKIAMKVINIKKVTPLKKAASNPKEAQSQQLLHIIKINESTAFGIEHDFKNIKSVKDFKARVPIRDYEEHRPYIERIFTGEDNSISATPPHYFTKTSGTTGLPKYIPVNIDAQNNYITSQQILSHSLYSLAPDYLSGDIFSVTGVECEEILFNKWPCGSMSGKLYSLAHKSIKAKHVFQKDIAKLNDSEKKYFYLAALALLSPNISFYVSPNPSTLLKIFEVINSKRFELKKLIIDGSDPIISGFANHFPHALELLETETVLKISDVWQNLKVLSLWTHGSCSYLIPQIKNQIAPKTHLTELGFLCSEFYGTLPVDANPNNQIPTLLDNYFEFIEKNDYESGSRETIDLHELKINSEYYIIVTTPGCFYRYNIFDIIKVTGFYESTPTIVFSQKGKGITNITGEKLSEKQLISFFEMQNSKEHIAHFFICLADLVSQSYTLYLELDPNCKIENSKLEVELDHYLKTVNIEYASKVADQRLAPIKIVLLKTGTAELFRSHCIKKGQSEAQFKFLFLQLKTNIDFPFEAHER